MPFGAPWQRRADEVRCVHSGHMRVHTFAPRSARAPSRAAGGHPAGLMPHRATESSTSVRLPLFWLAQGRRRVVVCSSMLTQ